MRKLFLSCFFLLGTIGGIRQTAIAQPGMAASDLFLTMRPESNVGFSHGGYGSNMLFKYYYGFEGARDYINEVTYFGTNLAEEVEIVPKAHRFMKVYMWSRIGVLAGVFGGFGLIIGNSIYQANKITNAKKTTGEEISFTTTPTFIGLGIIGVGIILHPSRHIWIHSAKNAYNERRRAR